MGLFEDGVVPLYVASADAASNEDCSPLGVFNLRVPADPRAGEPDDVARDTALSHGLPTQLARGQQIAIRLDGASNQLLLRIVMEGNTYGSWRLSQDTDSEAGGSDRDSPAVR